ncbi:MAG: hypothetical protein V1863_04220 [Candidatus Omnitrophota bacterium]
MKALIRVLVVLILLVVAVLVGYLTGVQKGQSEVKRARTEAAIYRAESEKYAQVLRGIRQTAQAATVTEPAQ